MNEMYATVEKLTDMNVCVMYKTVPLAARQFARQAPFWPAQGPQRTCLAHSVHNQHATGNRAIRRQVQLELLHGRQRSPLRLRRKTPARENTPTSPHQRHGTARRDTTGGCCHAGSTTPYRAECADPRAPLRRNDVGVSVQDGSRERPAARGNPQAARAAKGWVVIARRMGATTLVALATRRMGTMPRDHRMATREDANMSICGGLGVKIPTAAQQCCDSDGATSHVIIHANVTLSGACPYIGVMVWPLYSSISWT